MLKEKRSINFDDLSGNKFGRLTVISLDEIRGEKGGKRAFWKCRCECGNIKITQTSSLKNGDTKSCGCIRNEKNKENFKKHGLAGTKFYNAFLGMVSRCRNKNNNSYQDYGGRGIRCTWTSFEKFKKDMYKDYILHVKNYGEKNTTIERTNVDGNYSKENCKWATLEEQANNKRNTIKLKHNGRIAGIKEWSSIIGINENTIRDRKNNGWSDEKIITTPIKRPPIKVISKK